MVYFWWAELPHQAVKRPVTAHQPTGTSYYRAINRYLVSGRLNWLGPRREEIISTLLDFLSLLT